MLEEQYVLQVYTRHKNALYRLCYCYMGNVQDASDAMQNALVKLLERDEEFESAEHERGWMMKVGANECRQILRHWWRKREDLDLFEEYAAQEERYEENGILSLVMALPVKYRVPIYMYYYEGYSTKEISRILHIKESTIFSRLRRGRQQLRIGLDQERSIENTGEGDKYCERR